MNPLIKSQMLYRLSYRGKTAFLVGFPEDCSRGEA